jgi:hypothetical protein
VTTAGAAERYGGPPQLVAASRSSISLTSGENSIQTKKAVASQTATLSSVIRSYARRATV